MNLFNIIMAFETKKISYNRGVISRLFARKKGDASLEQLKEQFDFDTNSINGSNTLIRLTIHTNSLH
jgi:hypothetical protein